MRARTISVALAIGLVTGFSSPTLPQTALPDLPTIGERLKEYKKSYDEVSELAEKTEAELVRRSEAARKAELEYRATFYEHQDAVRAASLEEARAQKAKTDTTRAVLEYRKNVSRVQYRKGTPEFEKQVRARVKLRELEQAKDAAEKRLKAAKEAYNAIAFTDPAAPFLARMGGDRSLEKRQQINLANVEALLLRATRLYTREMLKHPPPYLQKIEVSDGSTTYYSASWQLPQGQSTGVAEDRSELLKVKKELEDDIKEMDEILTEHAQTRAELRNSFVSTGKFITRKGDKIENYEWAVAIAPIIIDSAAFIVDLHLTGGIATASEKFAAEAAETALEKALIRNVATSRNTLVKYLGKGIPAVSAEVINQKAGGKTAGEVLEGIAKDGTGITNSGDTIALSDMNELVIASGVNTLTSKEVWKAIKSGDKVIGKLGPGYLKSMKSGAPAAIATSAIKVLVNKHLKDELDATRRAFLEANMQYQVAHQIYSRSLLNDREMIELRKELRAALAGIQFKLDLDGRQPELVKAIDKPIPADVLRDGKLRVKTFFNQGITVDPIIKFGDDFLLSWSKVGGFAGQQWVGSKLSGKGYEDAEEARIFVTISEGNAGHQSMDGKPDTVPQLDFKNATWKNFERLADGNHTVKIDGGLLDLTGFWKSDEGQLLYFNHRGNTLRATVMEGPDRGDQDAYAIFKGDRSFVVTITGREMDGKILNRPRLRHYDRCRMEFQEDVTMTLLPGNTQIIANNLFTQYRVSTCKVVGKAGPTKRIYNRVLDDNGKPKR